jgi:hypothetical protein
VPNFLWPDCRARKAAIYIYMSWRVLRLFVKIKERVTSNPECWLSGLLEGSDTYRNERMRIYSLVSGFIPLFDPPYPTADNQTRLNNPTSSSRSTTSRVFRSRLASASAGLVETPHCRQTSNLVIEATVSVRGNVRVTTRASFVHDSIRTRTRTRTRII